MLAHLFLTKSGRGAPHLLGHANHASDIETILEPSSCPEIRSKGVRILMLTRSDEKGHDSAAFSEGGPRIDQPMSEELARKGWPKSPFLAS